MKSFVVVLLFLAMTFEYGIDMSKQIESFISPEEYELKNVEKEGKRINELIEKKMNLIQRLQEKKELEDKGVIKLNKEEKTATNLVILKDLKTTMKLMNALPRVFRKENAKDLEYFKEVQNLLEEELAGIKKKQLPVATNESGKSAPHNTEDFLTGPLLGKSTSKTSKRPAKVGGGRLMNRSTHQRSV